MSKSTSINDLPKNDSNTSEDVQESMMVNSILKEIENEEEVLNDENEDSMNYVMDTSQIPPKIQNEIPTKEMLESVTQDLFNNNLELNKVEEDKNENKLNSDEKNKKEIQNLLKEEDNKEKKNNSNSSILSNVGNIDLMMENIKKRVSGPIFIFIFFMILTHKKVNDLLFRILPKTKTITGQINNLGNLIKAVFMSVLYFLVSFFV
tara:strand:+ start:1572 stop:2189 length:618 start_codon:yes stop_codon:yes gene_type:complete